MAHGYLLKADFPGQNFRLKLMGGKCVGVDEDNGNGVDAIA